MTGLLPEERRREVAAGGVRLSLHRADPPRRRRTTPTLLLHGMPQTADMWHRVIPELARDRTVLAPDLKGLGRSEVRAPYDVPTLVHELAALVLHEVDGPVDVVGHDWGGSLAIALAAARPELVRRLVVMNAAHRTVDLRRAWHVPFFALPAAPEAAFWLSGRRVAAAMLRFGWRSQPPAGDDLTERYVTSYTEPDRFAAMLGYYRAASRHRAGRALRALASRGAAEPAATVRGPSAERALVVWGMRDPVLPAAVGRAVARALGGDTEFLAVPDAGHFVVDEAPDVVVPAVAAFLRAKVVA